MSLPDSISLRRFAWKNVTRKMFRNIVLVTAVALLVGLLVFALLFNKAVKDDIETASKRLGADIVLVPAEAQSSAEEFILESKEKTFYMDPFLLDALSGLEEIDTLNYHTYLNTLDAGCCSIDEGQVIMFSPDNDFVITPWLNEISKKELGENEVYVGNYVYEYLGLIDTASLFGTGVKIVGHLEYTGTGIDHGIFIRQQDIEKLSEETLGDYKKGTISIVFIKAKKGVDVDMLVAKIRDINPRIGIMTQGSIGSDVRNTLSDILRIFSVTILISSLLAVLLAWSTFSAIAGERKREVGILRAIGARKTQIINMFLSEALMISLMGGLLGVILGHLLITYLATDFHLLNRINAVSDLSVTSILVSLTGLSIGCAVCLAGALLPIMRLAGLEPLLAIKEE
jgi:putative ABC transport system permease protein